MAATTLISLEEYLHTSYEPDMEYADGVLIGRNVGTQLHGLLQTVIGAWLHQLRGKFRFQVFTETRLRMSASGRHYVPDVMVVEHPYERGKVVTDVPAVVFEIKSPDDKLDEVFEKCMDYASLGIPNIIVNTFLPTVPFSLLRRLFYNFRRAERSCLFQRSRCLPRWTIDRQILKISASRLLRAARQERLRSMTNFR